MKPIYTEGALAEGGREGRVHTYDGKVDLTLSQPKAAGGSGAGTNPEALFAAGYSACFHGALMFVGRMQKKDVTGSTVEGHVTLGQKDDGRGFELAVKHVVTLPGLAQAEAEALVEAAHQVCPYSNATRGNIPVDFEVRGTAA